jgi:hypothetical protein
MDRSEKCVLLGTSWFPPLFLLRPAMLELVDGLR